MIHNILMYQKELEMSNNNWMLKLNVEFGKILANAFKLAGDTDGNMYKLATGAYFVLSGNTFFLQGSGEENKAATEQLMMTISGNISRPWRYEETPRPDYKPTHRHPNR